MRILYISFVPPQSGAFVHTSQFISALRELNQEVFTFTPRLSSAIMLPQQDEVALDRPRPFREIRALGGAFLKMAAREISLMRNSKPDVVILREDRYISSLLISRLLNIPTLFEVNSPFLEQYLLSPDEQLRCRCFWEWYEKKIIRLPDHVMVVSEPLRRFYISRGLSPGKITTVPNGVDIDLFNPGIDGREVRAALGMDRKVVIGFAGSAAPWHGLSFLAEMLSILVSVRPDLQSKIILLLVGDARSYRKNIPRIPDSLTVITGSEDHGQMPRYLAAMDIFVAPYPPIDPFYFSPLKIFEAMAMGLPVLASAQGQITELIEDEASGCLYPAGSQKVFLEKLGALIDSPERRSSLGRRARETMEKKYTWRNNASRVLALCQSLGRST